MKKYLAIIGTSFPEVSGATKVTEYINSYFQTEKIPILKFSHRTSFNYSKYKINRIKNLQIINFLIYFFKNTTEHKNN